MFLQHGTTAEPVFAHFLINSLNNWADHNISILKPFRRDLAEWVSFSQERSSSAYSEFGGIWATGSASSPVRMIPLSLQTPFAVWD